MAFHDQSIKTHEEGSRITHDGLNMDLKTQMPSINEVEYFEGFDELDQEAQMEAFEKALYKLKGGFGASRRGGPNAFYRTIDEVRDHFAQRTSF